MPSCQREIGRAVMIEIPRFPVVGIVTVLALRRSAQRPAMMIVLVARGASNPFGRIILARVTLGTLECCMFAQQGEAGEVMVKANPRLPAFVGMAALAVTAQVRCMDIVLGVA